MASDHHHNTHSAQEALEAFVYAVSHDMSAPVRAISGFSEMIEQRIGETFDEKTARQFAHITNSATMLQAMLSALTDYSRLNTVPMQKDIIDSRQLIDQAWTHAKSLVDDTNATLYVSGELPTITGDYQRLQMVFDHLIDNALTYRAGAQAPSVTIEYALNDGRHQFSIADNGIGFEMNDYNMSRLYRPFGRLTEPSTPEHIGMGLTLAQKIIELHGGHVWCESALEKGATFCFSLPA